MQYSLLEMMESADPLWNSSDDHGGSTINVVRYYGCTFCKRGFSNAQALGGHMNIHRKDRAKLKQPTKVDHQILPPPADITKKSPSSCPFRPTTGLNKLETEPTAGHDPTCTLRFPWFLIPGGEDGSTTGETHDQVRPLFVDFLMVGDDPDRPSVSHGQVGQQDQVDLELRLGPLGPKELSLGFPFPKDNIP